MHFYARSDGPFRDHALVHNDTADRPLRVAHFHPAAIPGEEAFVPYLPTAFRVEGRLVEHDLYLLPLPGDVYHFFLYQNAKNLACSGFERRVIIAEEACRLGR